MSSLESEKSRDWISGPASAEDREQTARSEIQKTKHPMKTNWWGGAFGFGLAILVLLWSEAWIGGAKPRKSQVKRAIISTDPSGDVLADGLTVELARVDGITVLERAEVGKVVNEMSSLWKAAGILGADVWIVLEPRKLLK